MSRKSGKPDPSRRKRRGPASRKSRGAKRRGRKGQSRRRGGLGARLRGWALTLAFVGLLGAAAAAAWYYSESLSYDLEELRKAPQRTLVYDRRGELLGHVSGHGENRLVVPVSQVSPHFVNALLAREDSRFYQHDGVDPRGVLRAVVTNLKARDFDQGASTLTMQLARNTYGMRDLSLHRKMLEVALAARIERHYTKEEILGFYMNRIYFGAGLYGVERAAQGYFMKPAAQLSLGESAMLAGVIRGPSVLNPFRNLEDALAVRDEVLGRLVETGAVTAAEAQAARAETVRLRPPEQRFATGSYVLQSVYDLLSDFLHEDDIRAGGLKVHTTVDSNLQGAAERALDSHLRRIEGGAGFPHPPRSAHRKGGATRYVQGTVVSLDNSDGGVLALVGGRDFGESPFNRAFQAKRQVGSTFKPFLYAAAMERAGLLPGAYVSDDPVRIQLAGASPWEPKNSDGTFTGLQPAAVGLIRSRNTMSVRVGQAAGLETVRSLADTLFFSEAPASPVVYLGAFEATPMAVTSAYSTFAAKGVNLTPYLIERIENAEGRLLYRKKPGGRKVFSEAASWVISDVLAKVMDEGTGASARRDGYQAPASGKTGTTNDYRDAWFVGYTDKVTTGVWVGLDQPKKIMERGYGGTLALPVWTEVMKTAETAGYAAARISPPAGTAQAVLCRECGGLGDGRTRQAYQMDLPPDLHPRHRCRGHGGGLFAGREGELQAFPIDGEALRPVRPLRREDEGGVERAVRSIGRFLFGERR